DGWLPEQRVTREEALRGFTIDAAYAAFDEDLVGSITVGKRADFVLLDKDIMTVPLPEILEAQVVATFIDGTPAFESDRSPFSGQATR
ncbi:MAG: amidohydrolase family protein, partial [Rhodothermales bacterium]|nr:amidohydrolase family protein [Rhodothermales bacterium]